LSRAPSPDYDISQTIAAVRRFWWVALLVPLLVAAVLTARNLTADYQSSFRATVLMPGDTEIPGSSERPELMILDDIGPTVASDAFAELVADQASVDHASVVGHLSADRYSRVVTVTARSDSRDTAELLASAASTVLPAGVNQLMVAQGAPQATVRIIDPPGSAIRGDADKWRITGIATIVGLGLGLFLALLADAAFRQTRPIDAD